MTLTTVEALERRTSTFLRRWLSVPKSFCSTGLYSSGSKLQLPITSVTAEFKVAKTWQVTMLRDSSDQLVRQAGITIRTGRKWSASRAVADAEARLRYTDIVGTINQGRLGLAAMTRARWRDANAKGHRSLVQEELHMVEEEDRQVRTASMKNQGRWTCWGSVQGRPLGWRDMWSMEEKRIKFLLCSTYNVLPTPVNLHRWGLAENPGCMLCGKPASLEQVLSSCQASLADGKFRWRHDQILGHRSGGGEKEDSQHHQDDGAMPDPVC